MKTPWLLSLLIHFGVLQTCFAKKCYYPNGEEAFDFPCDPDAEDSVCCADVQTVGQACLSNKLCVSSQNRIARGSCTDKTWRSPECAPYCMGERGRGADLVSCSNVTGTNSFFCCSGVADCCDSGVGRFEAPPADPFTWAVWEKTGYAVLTPRSASSPSASSPSSSSSQTTGISETPSTSPTGAAADGDQTSGTRVPKETAPPGGSETNQSSAESNESAGLSTAAQAGIGVGVAVGALLVAAVAFLWWKLSKTQRAVAAANQASRWQDSHPAQPQGSTYYPQDPHRKYELQGERGTHELPGHQYFLQGDARNPELSTQASYSADTPGEEKYLPEAMAINKDRPRYRDEILKMMFVAGEMREPPVETTTVVEKFVRDQTIHMLVVAGELAARRGQAKFTTNDILFQVRHDPGRLARLQNHMRWKQIRKKAKVKDDEAADDVDLDEVDDLIDEDDGCGEAEATGPADEDSDFSAHQSKNRGKMNTGAPDVSIHTLPWELLSMFPHALDIPAIASLEMDDGDSADPDLGLLPGKTTNPWLLDRLMKNDERTRGMTADEYTTWSECRAASFTYRKKKAFREWCGLGVVADYRAKDDVLEILGFLTSEWVQTLTERALVVKEQEARAKKFEDAQRKAGLKRKLEEPGPFSVRDDERKREGQDANDEQPVSKSPVQPCHVRRAFEVLQTPPKKYTAMVNGTQLRQRKRLRIF
ncbi:transcription initiation factor IID, 18kD subunit-domain-containing protein [Chaetomidium leptoderma]|uniref:Transcription initiation factor IID, 18kD subunit-domain-containing protein n=1 Tax=Chaetomidium leptoderma TaxID=669021 RepID=A0AAN6ZW77_9PEZI|nr:transcription initiation factor IID, 18kD subunit-domain-containing protein [Chaetomidium leptoderma]